MAIFAVVNVEGGVVSNVVIGEDIKSVETIVGPCVEVTDETGPAVIGGTWIAQTDKAPGRFILPS